MKLIIDVPDEIVKKGFEEPLTDEERKTIIRSVGNAIQYKERSQGDTISREALLKELCDMKDHVSGEVFSTAVNFAILMVENAPTVENIAVFCEHGNLEDKTGD